MVRRCAGCDSRAGTGKTFATAEVGSIDWYVFTDAVFSLVLAWFLPKGQPQRVRHRRGWMSNFYRSV